MSITYTTPASKYYLNINLVRISADLKAHSMSTECASKLGPGSPFI
jgi:hypothetical protein